MRDFTNFLLEKNIIQQLRKTYNLREQSPKDKDLLNMIIDDLKRLKKQEGSYLLESNIIGKLHEKRISNSQKKKFGQFYTPLDIVKYILDAIGYTCKNELNDKKIVDLSCGCGSFLIIVSKRIVKFNLKKFRLGSSSNLSYDQVRMILEIIQMNLYGLDTNPLACILCCINIYLSLYDLIKIAIQNNPNYEIPRFKIYNINALEFTSFSKFDFVVGNPPYIFLRDINPTNRQLIEKGNFETIKGQYDYYQIFIELGIRVLKNSGYLGYIIPDSLLVLSNRKEIRKFMYLKTKIRELYYVGRSFNDLVVSNVIIILEKESNEKKRLENFIILKNELERNPLKKTIKQMVLKKWDYNFLLNLNETDINILDYLNSNFLNLKEINKNPNFKIKISRGVELGKQGKILYCKNCEKYIPLPTRTNKCKYCNSPLDFSSLEKIIVDKIPHGYKNEYEPYLFSMSRYQTKEYKHINIKKKGINYKDLEIYKDRIVIRQLSQKNLICATYDKYSLTSQSFYNLKIIKSSITEFNHYYLLALINSQLLSYYFFKMFGSYKALFPRILIEKIKKLPILIPKTPKERLIAKTLQEAVKKILCFENKAWKEINNLQAKINSLVFKIYQISAPNELYISEILEP
ncbi:MAG: Eco57I restriction-modification methylase domain-containing protein [Promethearchaeota archaeon]